MALVRGLNAALIRKGIACTVQYTHRQVDVRGLKCTYDRHEQKL